MPGSPPTPSLYKRKDFLGVDEEAHSHPNRTYYFRKNVDIEEVIETCSKRLSTHSNDTKALFLRGSSMFKRQKYAQALQDLNTLASLEPGHIEGHYYRGMALSKMNRQEEAIEILTKVLEMNPNHVNAAFARAACYNTIGQFSRAIEDYNFALLKDETMASVSTSKSSSATSGGSFVPSPTVNRSRVTSFSDYAEAAPNWMNSSTGPTILQSPTVNAASSASSTSKLSPSSSLETTDLHSLLTEAQSLYDKTHGLSGKGTNGLQSSAANSNSQSAYKQNAKMILPPPLGLTASSGFPRSQQSATSQDHTLGAMDSQRAKPIRRQPPPIPVAAQAHVNRPQSQVEQDQDFLNMSSQPSKLNSRAEHTREASYPIPEGPSVETTDAAALAEHYHATGYQYRRSGDFEAAVSFYTKALGIAPAHFKALFNRGFAKDKLGLYEEAVADYSAALKLEPQNAFAYYNRGISNDRRGCYDNAYADFSEAILLIPDNADFYHNRAFCLRKLNRLKDAVSDYGQALSLQPSHFKALHNRAYCLERLNDLNGAVADYSSALAMEPRHVASLTARAVVYERLEMIDLALSDYELALKCVVDTHEQAHNNRLSTDTHTTLDTIKSLQSELHLLVSIARLLSKAGKWSEATARYSECLLLSKSVEDGEKAISSVPGTLISATDTAPDPTISVPAILCARGINYKTSGQFKKAIDDFSAVIQQVEGPGITAVQQLQWAIPYHVATVYNHRGFCYRKLDMYEESISDYTIAIKHFAPQDCVKAYNNRAYCFARLERYSEAVADYTRVIALDPLNSHAYHNRGISLDKLGQFDLAIADFTKVLNIDSHIHAGEALPLDRQDLDELEGLKQKQDKERAQFKEEKSVHDFSKARTAEELDENASIPFSVSIKDAAPPLSPPGARIINASAFLASLPPVNTNVPAKKNATVEFKNEIMQPISSRLGSGAAGWL